MYFAYFERLSTGSLFFGGLDQVNCGGGVEMVKVNGEDCQAAGVSLTDWLQLAGYNPQAVAVEYNDRILPKNGYDSTILQDGDVVEIVCFMGGG